MENTYTTIQVDVANFGSNSKPITQRTPIKSPLQKASLQMLMLSPRDLVIATQRNN